MKSRVFLLLLVLVAGAIVNVAVAWGSAWAILPTEITSHQYQDWAVGIYESPSAGRVLALHNPANASASKDRTFPRWSNWPGNLKNTDTRSQMVDVRGWPMFALRSEHLQQGWVSGIALAPVTAGSKNVFQQRALPVDLLLPGFAINTLFYAGVLWLLFAALFALRRGRRIKRGLCPKCAYDLRNRASDCSVCPECGAPAPPPP